ncbi:M23 family metallopeptidase [Chryseobacterium scophthalmum]|uniref:M23 family metallopeptidase n=1 Tax=Chryseobacterium scophthalmum TaxID=59733 RepID=UPI00398B4163
MEKLRARAYCVNMLKKELVFTLWEDDAKGEGHNANNKLIETRKAKVNENGIAVTEFMLTKALMKKAMQGETDPKQLEFYVTVEYYSHKKHATDNVNINNPFPPIKHEVPVKPRGVPKAKGSPAAAKPASKKEERGILENVRDWWKDFDLWDWGESSGTIKKDKPPTVQKPDGRSPVIVKGEKPKENNETCVCKQYDLIWGGHSNVSCEFRKKVVEISKRQNFDPNHLMAVMKVESAGTFSPSKIELKITGYRKNGKPIREYKPLSKEEILKKEENFSGAVGLIQFTPAAINQLNSAYGYKLTKRKLALMSQLEQLSYVEKYIEFWKKENNIITKLTLADLYLVVFAPGKVNGSDDNTTLYAKDTKYYDANASVDTDGKNGITKKEIAARAYQSFTEGQLSKESNFECGNSDEQAATGKSNKEWYNPLQIMEIRGWYGANYNDWAPSASKFGKVPRRKSGIHQGIDLWAKAGTELKACVKGTVVFDGLVGDYGKVIVLEGEYKGTTYYFTYAHLSASSYKNKELEAGDPIALSGKSGNASSFPSKAQHLHFEIRTKLNVRRGLLDRLDPMSTISELNNVLTNAKKATQK